MKNVLFFLMMIFSLSFVMREAPPSDNDEVASFESGAEVFVAVVPFAYNEIDEASLPPPTIAFGYVEKVESKDNKSQLMASHKSPRDAVTFQSKRDAFRTPRDAI